MNRFAVYVVVFVFVIGIVVGAVLHRTVTHHGLPPVQMTMQVELASSRFVDAPDMAVYARDLAAQVEARFHDGSKSAIWPQDLAVTAKSPVCFESRQSCGPTVVWSIEFRTKRPLDPPSVAVAIGRGDLTIRTLTDARTKSCSPANRADAVPTVAPFVDRADRTGCLSLGPVVQRLTDLRVAADLQQSPTARSVVYFDLSQSDSERFAAWYRPHPRQFAVVLDGSMIAIVRPGDFPMPTRPLIPTPALTLRSVPLRESMAEAIAAAIAAPKATAGDAPHLPTP